MAADYRMAGACFRLIAAACARLNPERTRPR
jgi:hypothetical protein